MGRNKKIKIERAEERKKEREEIKREAILPLQVPSWEDYLTAIVLSTLTFVVYAFTAAPGVTLEDSGDFINGVLTLGIVHPPGYPLYTVLGHLFSLLPFGEPAFRINLFSALWGSLCLGVMFLILRILSIERIHAVFATLFLGFTTVFWSKTAVAEVYSFNAFLIGCIVFWILSYNRDKKKSQLYLVFLTTGLALSNHYPLVILTGIGLVFLLDRRHLQLTDFVKGLVFLGLGLTPYLYLFIQTLNPDLQYNFGKNSDFGMVLDHILRKNYASEFAGTLWDKFILAFRFLKAIITNFLFSSLFLFFGIAFGFLEKWKYRYSVLVAALSTSFGLILILTFPSDDLQYTSFLSDYSVSSFLFFSFFLALGLKKLLNRYVKNKIAQVSMLVILLITQVGFNFRSSSHHNDKLAEIWGIELLNSLEPNSILILCSQPGDMALYYLQLIKGLRQDVTIYDRNSFWTKDNLYEPALLFKMKHDPWGYRSTREQQLINNSPHPIYYTCKDAIDKQNINFSITPFLFLVNKGRFEASDNTQFTVSDGLLHTLVNGYPKSDYWLYHLRRKIFSHLISYYGRHDQPEVNRIVNYFMKTKFYSDPQYILSLADNVYYSKNYDLSRKFYERAERLSLEAFSPTDLAVFCYILAREEDYEKALPICMDQEQSSAPCEGNTIATRQ
ncbi:MAG: DUF2723 domain-containing protein, partial [Thermodesulfobacteriota bacterium]